MAVVVGVDIAEGQAVARLVALVRRLVRREIVDDRVELGAQFGRRRALARGHVGLVERMGTRDCGPLGDQRRLARHEDCDDAAGRRRRRRLDDRDVGDRGRRLEELRRGEAADMRAGQAGFDLEEAFTLRAGDGTYRVAVRQLRDHIGGGGELIFGSLRTRNG